MWMSTTNKDSKSQSKLDYKLKDNDQVTQL